jgi:hypothetical protein
LNATVTVVNGSDANKFGVQPGTFVFTRTGTPSDLAVPLSVSYTLGGTATKGSNSAPGGDYLVWEPKAVLAAGATTACVTILPRNDTTGPDGNTTVVLTISSGSNYAVGTPSSATMTIFDYYQPGFSGVFDPQPTDTQGLPLIAPDLTYLDAGITPGSLNIQVGVNASFSILLADNIDIFLNTDQNMATGDYRPGHVAGQEYRIWAHPFPISSTYDLFQLPTQPPSNSSGLTDPNQDNEIGPGITLASYNNGLLTLQVPLQMIGNPSAVDVFATSDIGSLSNSTDGVGDRVPKFGALDTTSHQVVVRQPAATQHVHVTDKIGDANPTAFDLTDVYLDVVADQFALLQKYMGYFDATNPTHFPGPRGEILVDSDQNLLTGGWPMGNDIATWGGDMKIFYDLNSLMAPAQAFLLQPGSYSGGELTLGQTMNDGTWLALGDLVSGTSTLRMTGSISLLDATIRQTPPTADPLFGVTSFQPVPTTGPMYFQAYTLGSNYALPVDEVPDNNHVIDTSTGQPLAPFSWGSVQSATDPMEYGQPTAAPGEDIYRIDAQVIRGNLVLRGRLTAWLNTQYGNLFTIYLDTDMNANTAPLGTFDGDHTIPGQSLGVDYKILINSREDIKTAGFGSGLTTYIAGIVGPDGTTTQTDSILEVSLSNSFNDPGSFTLTIPLSAIGNPSPQVRLYMTTGVVYLFDDTDVAPEAQVNGAWQYTPMVINTGSGVLISESGGETDVTEGGGTDSYTVVLGSQPTANVSVTASPDSQETVSPTSLVFTPNNWNVPQTITVKAVDDNIAQGPHTGTITHSVTSTDPNFNGVPVRNVVVHITDNDLAKYVVTTAADLDSNFNVVPGSLRDAIQKANAHAGYDEIDFNIPGGGSPTIFIDFVPLPAITGPLFIDGTTQPGYSDTNKIEINGTLVLSGDGFDITGGGGTTAGSGTNLRGLRIDEFPGSGIVLNNPGGNVIIDDVIGGGSSNAGNVGDGIVIQNSADNLIGILGSNRNVISSNHGNGIVLTGSGTTSNLVLGNYIGTDAQGLSAAGNQANGMFIASGASGNGIGGNVISGNQQQGILIDGSAQNILLANYIGTEWDGSSAIPNSRDGIHLQNGATQNIIGTTFPGLGNVISGNSRSGVALLDSATTKNQVEGNWIGTTFDGLHALGNNEGVYVGPGVPNNTIGGATLGAGNLISGNKDDGIWIDGAVNNQVQGNRIGTDTTAAAALGNAHFGLFVGAGSQGNTIGGTILAAANVIAANGYDGIQLWGSGITGNVVEGNYIGIDGSGTKALGNGLEGVRVGNGASSNTIGGAAVGAGNIISANNDVGVWITSAGTNANVLQGNYIGTDLTGSVALGNIAGCVFVSNGASAATIGGTAIGAGNVISGNAAAGLVITDANTTAIFVQGNYIGTDATGTKSLADTGDGVVIQNGSWDDVIGFDYDVTQQKAVGARNVLSGNTGNGISLRDSGTTSNVIEGNYIGTDVTGAAALGNAGSGVVVHLAANGNTVGGDGNVGRNIISGNSGDGVDLIDGATTANIIQDNYIGPNATGTKSVANAFEGMFITAGANGNTIGGTAASTANVISGNSDTGIYITGIGTTGNAVLGNEIGTDANGTQPLGNQKWGVLVLGGPTLNLIAGNVLSANGYQGLSLQGTGTTNNTVERNNIGTDVTGTAPLGNGLDWILLLNGAANNPIGDVAGNGNTIAFNARDGIQVGGATTIGNALRGNSIFGNASLGIDLNGDGVTLNDSGDGDTGPNNLQNYPVITLVQSGSNTRIAGTLNSTANSTITLDFYSNVAVDPSGYGQGRRYLGSTTVATDGTGQANFDVTFFAATSATDLITATATDAAGNSSEFSTDLTDIQMLQVTADGFGNLTLSYRIVNYPALPFRIGLYVSGDISFGGDTLVSSITLSNASDLSQGLHTKMFTIGGGSGQVALPGAGAPDASGDYYLLAVADDTDAVPETDSDPYNGNNVAVFSGAYHVTGGGVFVQGSAANDTIILAVGSSLGLTLNGAATTYTPSDVLGFWVHSHDGNDAVNIESTATGAPVTVFLGAGTDAVTLSPTATQLANLAAGVTVVGGAGAASLTLDDQAGATNTTYTLTGTNLLRNGAAVASYSGVEALVLNGGSGTNTYLVQSTPTGTAVSLNAGTGLDAIRVGSATNTLDGLLGALSLNGQGAADSLTINDQGSTAGRTYAVTDTTLSSSVSATLR